ncbi:DNA-processing protein DprA [Pilimelia columellifera]|uniref:DNA-processing protein DprA n=1 Tax=Pilimelia columellifera subsp. columellifera TaxID=706583 RepID=A0ABN3N3X6_9ACTN
MTDPMILARIALTWLAEPGHRHIHQLVAEHGPEQALEQLMAGEVPDGRLRESVAARLAAGDPRRAAELALKSGERLGARVLTPDGNEWPWQLEDLARLDDLGPDDRMTRPPLLLWLRGARLDLQAPAVAVVGARASSPYGEHIASGLGHGLAERGWTVVSGGAYGIDAAAHRGSLTGGGPTVAVLACGVDRAYPAGHAALFEHIVETGSLISEWPPGSAPYRHRFLTRNRVIAALTRGTVVVEATARSGALATLRRASALGRPSMVVPGPVTAATSRGCHMAARADPQVRLVTDLADVLEEVGQIGVDLAPLPNVPDHPRDRLDVVTATVLDAVPAGHVVRPEEMSASAGVPLRQVLRALPALVELNLVTAHEGGYRVVVGRDGISR